MRIKNREKLLGLAAGLVIVLLVGEKLVADPLLGFWKRRADRIATLTKSLNNGKLLLEREKAIRARWETMRTNALSANLSAAENKVLNAVDRWILASRVNQTSIKPLWKQNTRNDEPTTLECRVDGSGDIRALTRFLYELERDPLALKIEHLEVTSRDDRGQQLALGVRFSGLKLDSDRP